MKKLASTTMETRRSSYVSILEKAAKTVKEAGFLKPAMDLEIAALDCIDSPTTRASVIHTLFTAIETITDKGGIETAKGLVDLTVEAYQLAC